MEQRKGHYSASKDQLLKRMRRIEGQVRGVEGMIEDDRYCIDVITQIQAAQAALDKVALGLLDEHVRHCVADAAKGDDPAHADRMVTEATRAIERLVKA